jgi:hypothetical protein
MSGLFYARYNLPVPRFTIPTHPGKFSFGLHHTRRHYLVMNDKTGKNQVIIPVANRDAAEELCRRLNAGEHSGAVSVPGLKR